MRSTGEGYMRSAFGTEAIIATGQTGTLSLEPVSARTPFGGSGSNGLNVGGQAQA